MSSRWNWSHANNSTLRSELHGAGSMMKRIIQILAALLVVQLVITVVVYWPRSSQAGGGPVFPDLDRESIVGLTVSDSEGNQVRLVKKAGSWVLPEADDYPAQESNVTALLDKLLELNTNRLITQTPGSHARLQVADDEFVRRIEFETQEGKAYTVYLGSSPRAGATHFRLAGQDEVYLAGGLSSFDAAAQPARYIDTGYISLPPSEIVRLELKNAQGTVTFAKDENGDWTMEGVEEGQSPDGGAIQALVNRASSLNMTRPVARMEKEACTVAEPQAVVTMTREKEGQTNTYTITVGAKGEDGQYLVRYSGAQYCVEAAEYTVSDFINKAAPDFILTPTPTPEAPATPAEGS
ncbi:MAG: DUF4340 domain-containing protein [Caldilineae bacterium]|nr:MAG: DUF4340 domain-containing protein [Caldilineae bacterium]